MKRFLVLLILFTLILCSCGGSDSGSSEVQSPIPPVVAGAESRATLVGAWTLRHITAVDGSCETTCPGTTTCDFGNGPEDVPCEAQQVVFNGDGTSRLAESSSRWVFAEGQLHIINDSSEFEVEVYACEFDKTAMELLRLSDDAKPITLEFVKTFDPDPFIPMPEAPDRRCNHYISEIFSTQTSADGQEVQTLLEKRVHRDRGHLRLSEVFEVQTDGTQQLMVREQYGFNSHDDIAYILSGSDAIPDGGSVVGTYWSYEYDELDRIVERRQEGRQGEFSSYENVDTMQYDDHDDVKKRTSDRFEDNTLVYTLMLEAEYEYGASGQLDKVTEHEMATDHQDASRNHALTRITDYYYDSNRYLDYSVQTAGDVQTTVSRSYNDDYSLHEEVITRQGSGETYETRKLYAYQDGLLRHLEVDHYQNGGKIAGEASSFEWETICGYYLAEPMTPFAGMEF